MADMTFKTNLLPSMNGAASGSSQSIYSLGSSSQKWILNGMAGNPVEYIVGTQTASTNLWTGNTADSALYDGKMILYVLPTAGTSTAATLNLTLKGPSGTGTSTTGAKPIYRYGSTTGVTTHFPALSRILLIYDATNNRWNSSAYYNTDSNVKSTAVTSATTNYIVGSTTSTTETGRLSKHASAALYTTADSGTSGYTQLRLGNTTATSSAGGKEGQIRLYGTGATYYLDLKPGAIASSNKTITFPDKSGTVALTSNIPNIIRSTENPTDASHYPVDTIWIKYGIDPMATMEDYITDTGTSDIWTWEKWASGKAECWGYDTITETLTHSQGGLYYGAAHSAQFPTGFFVGSHGGKSGLQSCQISVDGNALLWYYTGSSYVHTQTYYLANPASISGTFYVYYHAIGWWK